MFRYKNFKILIMLMLFAFAGQNAWAEDEDYWMYVHLKQKCEPTGVGKVYASTDPLSADNPNNCVVVPEGGKEYESSTHESNITNNWVTGTQWFVNTIPVDVWSYGFVGWKNGDGVIVSTEPSPLQSFYDPGVYAVDKYGNKTSKSGYLKPSPFPVTLELTAVYDEIDPIVVAVPENYSIGNTIISKANNKVTDNVEIFAYPIRPSSKFIGWYKDGVFETTENPYSFTIEDETKHTYTAKFRTGHSFYRVINKSTKRVINGVKDQGSITDLSALQLVDYQTAQVSAGSVFEIKYDNSKPECVDFIVQNFDPGAEFYNKDKGVFMCMRHKIVDNTWKIHPNRNTPFLADKGSGNVVAGEYNSNNYNSKEYVDWYLEPFDLDLETKENYFSLDPAKLIQLGEDEYYTTLRTSWDILFDHEQMTPYVVTSVVDELNGTFEMEPLEGNIIPKGTPVIIKTKSTDIEENRMVPIISNATKPTVNELTSSEKYFPDQSVSTSSNYKKLMVKDGQLAFGGDALNTVNGNEAYLCVAYDVILPNITLADLLKRGDTEKTYSVTDLTCVYARDNVLYCKDDDGARNRSKMEDGEIDYLVTVAGLQTKPWDQSNWVAVKLPGEANPNYLDHRLTKVVGRLTNTVNPEFEVTVAPSIGDENPYDENNYITCNFSGSHQENVTINGVEHNYYFVEPKPMEIANVKWALWNGKTFSKPSNASSDLNGEFAANFSFSGEPSSAGVYNFPALIKIAPTAQGIMPRAQDEATTSWLVFPLELTNQPVTAIDSLQSGKTVVKVVYYNLMGVESAVPHNGVNIVETRYSDGTRTTTKIIR